MLLTLVTSGRADACGVSISASRAGARDAGSSGAPSLRGTAPSTNAPIIVDASFSDGSRRGAHAHGSITHLRISLAQVGPDARAVLFESVWGSGPDALMGMWGRSFAIHHGGVHDGDVFVFPSLRGPHRDQPFTLGFRARVIYADGTMSPPSLPVFVNHAGRARSDGGIRADQVLMIFACLALFGMWGLYRGERDHELKIRLASATAMVALLFLSVTPALSWLRVDDQSDRVPSVECRLGDEVQCASYVPDSGPNPVSMAPHSTERRMEVVRWMSASSALRLGLIMCLVLLMPTLIWLLVVPGLRAAQASTILGASGAGYTFLASLLYRVTVPSWMSARVLWTADLAMVASASIMVAAGAVLYYGFQLPGPPRLPRATLRH
jgi:hypothetical protein